MRFEFEVSTDERSGVVDVTSRVADAIPAGADGICPVFVRHTTAGVIVNEAERGLLGDIEARLPPLVSGDPVGAHKSSASAR